MKLTVSITRRKGAASRSGFMLANTHAARGCIEQTAGVALVLASAPATAHAGPRGGIGAEHGGR